MAAASFAGGSGAASDLAANNPLVEHAAHGIGLRSEVYAEITEAGVPALLQVISDIPEQAHVCGIGSGVSPRFAQRRMLRKTSTEASSRPSIHAAELSGC